MSGHHHGFKPDHEAGIRSVGGAQLDHGQSFGGESNADMTPKKDGARGRARAPVRKRIWRIRSRI
jgi:hypothetical protein